MGILSEIPFGTKYGKLVVVSEAEHQKHPSGKMKRMVNVQCDCGNMDVKAWQDVRAGQSKSCSFCPKDMPVKDIAGMVVYRLTVSTEYEKRGKKVFWKCNCECGNEIFVDGVRLRNKRVRNCGECGSKMGSYYLGDKLKNNEGYTATVVGIKDRFISLVFEGCPNIPVEIEYSNIRNGNFANPFHKSVCGVGYFGVGRFIAKTGDKHTEEYENWGSMMKRCYRSAKHMPSYSDKYVSDDWHCFQNFAEWATTQIGFDQPDWHLDKDLLVKGNKVYSAETCVYIPREINSFIKRKRFNDLPLGVDIAYNYDGTPYYRVQGREDGKNLVLGRFYNIEEAFTAYKVHKEGLAVKLAEKWKDQIDVRAYEALINYKVEITD